MPIFKKRVPELIDITELQKKGTFQRSQRIAKNNSDLDNNAQDVVDLTIKRPLTESSSVSTNESSALGDFLSNLASVNSNSSSPTIEPTATITSTKSTDFLSDSSSHINALKIKLEDLEFKLDTFLNRLQKIEEKLGSLKGL